MGNYGDTVDRWYRRAALVLWLRSRTFVVRGKNAAQWAAARVREKTEAGDLKQAREMARSLLPHWTSAVRNESHAGSSVTVLYADVLHAAHGLADEALAAAWVAPLSLDHLAVPCALSSLIECYRDNCIAAHVLNVPFLNLRNAAAGPFGPEIRVR
jgi:hypothetical protein